MAVRATGNIGKPQQESTKPVTEKGE